MKEQDLTETLIADVEETFAVNGFQTVGNLRSLPPEEYERLTDKVSLVIAGYLRRARQGHAMRPYGS